jgi:hypothetical protein
MRLAQAASLVGRPDSGGRELGALGRIPEVAPRLQARGRASSAGGERCHGWFTVPPAWETGEQHRGKQG